VKRFAASLLFVCLCTGVVRAELIGFYRFEGNLNDDSGKGNHGTFGANAPALTANGFQGQAYQFGLDGLFTTITVPIDINPAVMPQVTFGAWVNADITEDAIRGFLSHDTGGYDRTLDIDTRADGVPRWCIFTGNTGGLCADPVQPGEWTFVAARYNQATGQARLTINGNHYDRTGTLGTGQSIFTIGRNPSFDQPFVGRMDNVFVFSSFLSDEELAAVAAPEPGSWVLGGAGLVALGLVRRRKVQSNS
jgi:MYXO-CTERM domain-containing protein